MPVIIGTVWFTAVVFCLAAVRWDETLLLLPALAAVVLALALTAGERRVNRILDETLDPGEGWR